MPGANPGEGYANTNLQLFGSAHRPIRNGGQPRFCHELSSTLAGAEPMSPSWPGRRPMNHGDVHAGAAANPFRLARGFAVCDRWFISVPTMTLPNRAFPHAAPAWAIWTTPAHAGHAEHFRAAHRTRSNWTSMATTFSADPPGLSDITEAEEAHFGFFTDFLSAAPAGSPPP